MIFSSYEEQTLIEFDLDLAFATRMRDSTDFCRWLLRGSSKFAGHADTARLLHREQEASRDAKHWWRHWWCRLPDGSESETDILAVFARADRQRFALHIENKPPRAVSSRTGT